MRVVLCLLAALALVAGKPVDSDAGEIVVGRQYDSEYVGPFAVADTDAYDGDENGSSASDESDEQSAYDDGGYDDAQGAQLAKRSVPAAEAAPADADDADARSTKIALSDLVGAVEHSLVHSAQQLGLGSPDATVANDGSAPETSTVIALPIALPTASDEDAKDSSTTASVQPIRAGDSLDALSVIAVSTTTTSTTTQAPATGLISITDDAANNVTILQTINSTLVQLNEQDATQVDRVQQQHITLFSAGAGVLPLIPAVSVDDFVAANRSSEQSDSDESTAAAGDCADSSESSSDESKSSERRKCLPSTAIRVAASSSSTTTTSTSSTTAKPTAAEILQEKIAEVEAEPVILTQGI